VDSIEAAEKALATREAALAERVAELEDRERELAERVADLQSRETKLAEREISFARRLDELAEHDGEAPKSAVEDPPAAKVVGEPAAPLESTRRIVRTGGRLAATLQVATPTSIASIQQIGGANVLVETVDGRSLRVSAHRDAAGHFSVTYETVGWQDWQGRRITVWEPTSAYPPCKRELLEDCLEAALAAIDAGEYAVDETADEGDPVRAHGPAEETAAPRRKRRFLALRRGG
jgi:hypothetical protein